MVTRRLRVTPMRGPARAWITIAGIWANTRTAMTACKNSEDFLNARHAESERRLCAPVIQVRLDGLVPMPEHIRAHIVI